MVVSYEHDRYKHILGRLIETLCFELDVEVCGGGSPTFKKQLKERGLEPDECYWITSELAMRGKLDFDIDVDPLPDLALEVEVSRSALDKLGIYAALGFPEIWRFDGTGLARPPASGGRALPGQSVEPIFPDRAALGVEPLDRPGDADGRKSVAMRARRLDSRRHARAGTLLIRSEVALSMIARLAESGQWVRITVEGDRIAEVVPAEGNDGGEWVAPAFWDIQLNGRWGISFSDPSLTVEQVADVVRAQAALGTARLCPTLITARPEALLAGVRTIADACERFPDVAARVVGIHLEGPYISPEDGYRGAHPREAVRDPDPAEFARLQEAAGGGSP